MLILWFGETSEDCAVAIGMGMHQLAANSAASRQLPTQAKYRNNGMVRRALSAGEPIAVRNGMPR